MCGDCRSARTVASSYDCQTELEKERESTEQKANEMRKNKEEEHWNETKLGTPNNKTIREKEVVEQGEATEDSGRAVKARTSAVETAARMKRD